MAADEALRAGLVSDVVEPEALLDRADALLTDIGKAAPMALRLTKLAVNSGGDAHPHVELAAQALLFDSEEKHDRMTKFLNVDRMCTALGCRAGTSRRCESALS